MIDKSKCLVGLIKEVMIGEKRNTSDIDEVLTIRNVWNTRGLERDIQKNQDVSVLR